MRVCVIGLWHLGCVTAASLADLGHVVVGVDPDAKRVEELQAGRPPLFEPGLDALLANGAASGRLTFTSDNLSAAATADVVWFAFDTPVNDQDQADPTLLFATAGRIASVIPQGTTVLVSSQIPVGTCRRLVRVLESQRSVAVNFAYLPENLRLGQALERFRHPDMIVIGARSASEAAVAGAVLADIEAPRLTMGLEAAEMVKHAINGYLATCISFINELSNICELVGADAMEVAQGLRADRRVSPHAPLSPGLGFAGATLARDVRVLQELATRLGYAPTLVESVLAVNAWQNGGVLRKLQRALGSLAGRRISMFGLTYKPSTSTLRRSTSIETIEAIVTAGGTVAVYDPRADHPDPVVGVHFYSDPYEAAQTADAIVVMTAWPEFRDLDFSRLRQTMHGRIFVDAQNAFDMQRLSAMGFTYLGMGRPGVAASV